MNAINDLTTREERMSAFGAAPTSQVAAFVLIAILALCMGVVLGAVWGVGHAERLFFSPDNQGIHEAAVQE